MTALTTLTFVIAWPSHNLHPARSPAYGQTTGCRASCRKYGDRHLNQVFILKNQNVICDLPHHIIVWWPCWFSIFGGRCEYLTILFEIVTDENAGIDTKTSLLIA